MEVEWSTEQFVELLLVNFVSVARPIALYLAPAVSYVGGEVEVAHNQRQDLAL